MGHNIGMSHDFIGSTSNVRKDKDGNDCYGYMDYRLSSTHYWSTCSVQDISQQDKSCLKQSMDTNQNKKSSGLCLKTWSGHVLMSLDFTAPLAH